MEEPAKNARCTAMLERARRANPGRPEGATVVPGTDTTSGIVVAWSRITRTYEVGTMARVLARGQRAEVLPTLERLLAEVAP